MLCSCRGFVGAIPVPRATSWWLRSARESAKSRPVFYFSIDWRVKEGARATFSNNSREKIINNDDERDCEKNRQRNNKRGSGIMTEEVCRVVLYSRILYAVVFDAMTMTMMDRHTHVSSNRKLYLYWLISGAHSRWKKSVARGCGLSCENLKVKSFVRGTIPTWWQTKYPSSVFKVTAEKIKIENTWWNGRRREEKRKPFRWKWNP